MVTFVALRVISPALFASGGGLYPLLVAWVAGSLFALSRQPRHRWLHVAVLGLLVAAILNFYVMAMRSMFPPPPGVYGGANVNPPPKGLTPVPPQ